MTLEAEFARVLRYASLWGVEVKTGPPPKYEYGWFPSPFIIGPSFDDFGIWWPTRTIHWDCTLWGDGGLTPNGLLHELAHALMPVDPSDVEEVTSGMLAFEFFSSRRLRLSTWTGWMRSFTVTEDGYSWKEISNRERHAIVLQSLKGASTLGILDARGAPTFAKVSS